MKNTLSALLTVGVISVGALVRPITAANIPIQNASFEDPAAVDGQELPGSMANWVGTGTFAVCNPANDRFFGTTSGSPLPNPIDGLNIGGINVGGTIHQDLAATVEPGTAYTLRMLVGRRLGVPFGFPVVSLMAGGEVLTQAVPPAPADGTFSPFELVYNSPTNGTVIGQTLRIHFQSIGTDSQPWFDRLTLTTDVGNPPPPSDTNIVIVNASFELPVLVDGQYIEGNMPGWVGTGIYPITNPQDVWFAGTSQGSSQANPIDGANIGGINVGGIIYQDLAATLQPGVGYTLTMLVGHRAGVPFGFPNVSLMAGGQMLAEAVPSAPADGQFAPFELNYTSPTNGPLIGQPLRIQLRSLGAGAQPWFDNLKLVIGPPGPPPPPPGPNIAIANASFEQPALGDGQYIEGVMPGWIGSGIYPVTNPQNNWFAGTTAGSGLPNPIDGANIGGLNVGGTIYQDLNATVQPGAAYVFSLLVGHRAGVPFGQPEISLLAGGQVLSLAVPPAPADGQFAPFEMYYVAPTNGAVLGQTLRIQLKSFGIGAQPWFDNLKLVAGDAPAPTITSQPVSQTVVAGQDVSFSVSAIGVPELLYQWYRGGALIAGATTRSLALSSVNTDDAGEFFVVVSNSGGATTSHVAQLTVNLPPPCIPVPAATVAWWPFEGGGNDAVGGNAATFSAEAQFAGGVVGRALRLTGSGALASVPGNASLDVGQADGLTIEGWINPSTLGTQALFEWNNRAGAVGVHLYLSQPAPAGGGSGSLFANVYDTQNRSHYVTTPSGVVSAGAWQHIALTYTKSNGQARIYVNGVLKVASDLGSFTPQTGAGYDLLFGHRIGGGPQFVYAGGMDEVTLYARALEPVEVALIHAVGAGGKCNAGFPASIVANPQSKTVVRGDAAQFSVGASGSLPLIYQWRFNGSPIEGATNGTLVMENVQVNQAGQYSAVVSNEFGFVESAEATLTVTLPPAKIRVVNSAGTADSEVVVPVEIVANGNENAVGFSLTFNSSILSVVDIDLGALLPTGAALLVNTNSAAQGRLGVVVGLASQATIQEGTQTLALVRFRVAPILNQTSLSIGFGDQPTLRQLSDANANVLAATFTGGTLSIADSQFEGDVARRPDGDRLVTTIDWVQMGRFVARLNEISAPNEFQRADSAPRNTKGNGVISVSDWVQAGRYAVGLDPLTVIGGPSEPAGEGGGLLSAASLAQRTLKIEDTTVIQGQTSAVPVTLNCLGNENALSFSVKFNPAKLGYSGVGLGADAQGAALNVNTSQAAQGRIGVAVALQPGTPLPAGLRELVTLRFVALANGPDVSSLTFDSLPVPSEISDVAAGPVPANYSGGAVSIVAPTGPALKIVRSGPTVVVSWPASATGFELEATDGALGSNWRAVTGVITLGDQKLAIISSEAAERFFRLKKQ